MTFPGATVPGMAATRTIVAFLDGEDSPDIMNPIHSTAVAHEYGFRAALVGGVTVYGWLTPPLIEALGEGWLDDGWCDVSFKRPVYPGDVMTATVDDNGTFEMVKDTGERCLVGVAGRGRAPWFGDLHLPTRRAPEPRPAELPWLTLENAPVAQDLRPMPVPLSAEEARAYARNLQRDEHERWTGERPRLHPGWLAARMTPMIHHSYDYKPAIHARSLIQHLAPGYAGQTVTVAGHFLDAYERNGHHYAEVDGVVLAEDGSETVAIRHTTIFRPAKRDA